VVVVPPGAVLLAVLPALVDRIIGEALLASRVTSELTFEPSNVDGLVVDSAVPAFGRLDDSLEVLIVTDLDGNGLDVDT
jgi:hypothetical protein